MADKPSDSNRGDSQQRQKSRKESIVDLSRYLEKSIRVKFSGGREAQGILKGFDPLLNLVIDDTIEFLRGSLVHSTYSSQTLFLRGQYSCFVDIRLQILMTP